MLSISAAEKLLNNVNGSSFIGMDTEVEVKLSGGRSNPYQGRVTKQSIGASVMVFQNKKINGYNAMVHRRLEKEGKNSASFKLSPRVWGSRIEDTPFVVHKGEYYLEVIFLHPGKNQYLLDGKPIDKSSISGLPKNSSPTQGGLSDSVIVRVFKLSSIKSIRIDKTEYLT